MEFANKGICEFCGRQVGIRQKAHIIAEGKKKKSNILLLCPSCHIMFDTIVKPKIHKALLDYGSKNLPPSWETSIYEQAAKASRKALNKKRELNN